MDTAVEICGMRMRVFSSMGCAPIKAVAVQQVIDNLAE